MLVIFDFLGLVGGYTGVHFKTIRLYSLILYSFLPVCHITQLKIKAKILSEACHRDVRFLFCLINEFKRMMVTFL